MTKPDSLWPLAAQQWEETAEIYKRERDEARAEVEQLRRQLASAIARESNTRQRLDSRRKLNRELERQRDEAKATLDAWIIGGTAAEVVGSPPSGDIPSADPDAQTSRLCPP